MFEILFSENFLLTFTHIYYIFLTIHFFILKEVIIIFSLISIRQKELESQIQNIRHSLSNLPPGKLICTHSDNRYKWYISNPHQKRYLPKSQQKLAEQLAYKRYLTLRLSELENELQAINAYLAATAPPLKSDSLLINSPEFQRLTAPYFTPIKKELSDWMKHPYDKNPYFPDRLIHKSISGNFLRSKSEVIIDMLLFQKKIPYRYECQLQLGAHTIYPDFTLRHPSTGNFYYWEHFGQMDNPEYCTKACTKMQLYISHGYIPTINLITTFETQKHPLVPEDVNHIIEHYFT